MRKLFSSVLCFFACALPVHAGIVLRCDEIRAKRTNGVYDPAHSQWSFAYDSAQPIGPLEIVLWLLVAVLGCVVIRKLKPWIWLSALGRSMASRRERIGYFALSTANLFARLAIAAIWITLAGLVLVLLYRAGETSGFFVNLQNQISIWLLVLPAGVLENVFIGSVIAGLIAIWLATSKHTTFRARTRLLMLAGAMAVNLAGGALLACSPTRENSQTSQHASENNDKN
jgi:hypothetical protein